MRQPDPWTHTLPKHCAVGVGLIVGVNVSREVGVVVVVAVVVALGVGVTVGVMVLVVVAVGVTVGVTVKLGVGVLAGRLVSNTLIELSS